MPNREVTRRFVRGGIRSLVVEALVVAAFVGVAYLLAVVLDGMF
jgi:hypothetical protein